MKKKPAFRSAFFNPRALISFALCAIGVLVTLLAFGLYPGGKAFARQNQSNGLAQQTGPVRDSSLTQGQVPVTAQAVEMDIDTSVRAPLPPRPNAPTATFLVNTTADTQDINPGDGICADSGGNCSLRAAITESNALAGVDTVTLPAGTYTTTLVAANEDLNAGGDFDITSPLTINGAGSGTTIIQANAAPGTATERVMHITGAATNVNINNVTIRNGNSTVSTAGGGLRVDAATAIVNLTNVIITNNNVTLAGNVFGGGIFAGAGTLTMTGCTVSNNSAISTLSSTNGFAGGIYNQQATVSLINSTVTGNKSSSFHGGIRTLSSTIVATTNITNCTISNNLAQGLNGAGAPGEGGGVVNIAGSTFACTTNITASTISGNAAQLFGFPGANTTAGGVENVGVTTGPSVVNLTNSTVSGNTADFAGGVYSDGPAATMTLKYSTVDSNSATTQGGGLYQDVTAGGVTNLKSSIVANDSAPTGPDIFGVITSQNYNHVQNTAGGTFTPLSNDVTGTSPQLSPLQNNGGPTFTYVPLAGSPVLNTIPSGSNECGTTVAVDQRGIIRPQGGACDKGSVERTGNDSTPTPTPSASPSPTATATATIPPPTPTPTPTPTPVGCQVLYDQTDNASGTATSSQNFETANDTFDDQAADDFVVPAGNTWTIQQVFAPGLYYNGAGPAASVNVIFYGNSAFNLPDPANVVGTFSNVVPVDPTGSGSFTITLPLGGQLLTAGTYWISVQANMDFTPGGQWAWNDRSLTSNSPSAWQNPGNGFASGCTSWTVKTTCVAGSGPDMNFLLRGCLSVQSPTPTPTPTPTPSSVSISGNVDYCTNPALPPVPGVTMTLTGTSLGSTSTDVSGNYTFTGLASGGNYTVTPTKTALTPGSAGINTLDVIAIQRQFLNLGTPLTGCKLTAADVNGVGGINTLDVIATQRFFLGQVTGTANVGKYQFNPVNRTYTGLLTNQTAQNYDAIVFGDVAGSSFVHRPEGPSQTMAGEDMSNREVASTVAALALPDVAVDQSKGNVIAAVKSSEIDATNKLVGFQGDLAFDERVVTFHNPPVSNAGLTGGNWNVSGNVLAGAGPIRTLRISAYSNDFTPLSGSGILFNLNMSRVSAPGQSTKLIWAAPPDDFIFIDADLNTQRAGNSAPGSVTTSGKRK